MAAKKGSRSAPGRQGVNVTKEMMKDPNLDFALLEQLLKIKGPKAIKRFLAERLRKPSEYPAIPELVARLLELDANAKFRLEIVRHKGGKSPTRRFTDAAITKWFHAYGKEHLNKEEIGAIADEFNVSDAKVRQVITDIRRNT
jgi:hypothetical protein